MGGRTLGERRDVIRLTGNRQDFSKGFDSLLKIETTKKIVKGVNIFGRGENYFLKKRKTKKFGERCVIAFSLNLDILE